MKETVYKEVNKYLGGDYFKGRLSQDDWNKISSHYKLSEEFIEKYRHRVNWYLISKNQTLSEGFIEKYERFLNIPEVIVMNLLSEDFIEKNLGKGGLFEYDITSIFTYQNLSEDFILNNFPLVIKRFSSTFDGDEQLKDLFRNRSFSIDFIDKFIKKYEGFLKNNVENIGTVFMEYQFLGEDLIKDFVTRFNLGWSLVVSSQVLSPEFINTLLESGKVMKSIIIQHQPFIDVDSQVKSLTSYSYNYLSKLYQETKDRGWFIGYLDGKYPVYKKNRLFLNRSVSLFLDNHLKYLYQPIKVKLYWKDLRTINRRFRSSDINFIRDIKYVR